LTSSRPERRGGSQCTLAACADGSSWYCPASTQALIVAIDGGAVSSAATDVATLAASGHYALDALAGAGSAETFDWGLPFFYGRSVYTAGSPTPDGARPYDAR
jgi:hypothetical protein